jgi:hypothetical protein
LTVTLGKLKVGVAVMVGDNSMVGVGVKVGTGVSVLVVVTVACGVSVKTCVVAVAAGAVGVADSSVEGAQAEVNRKINNMIL